VASGLNGRWGDRTELDPARSVERTAIPQALASRIHYKMGKSAREVMDMDDQSWSAISGGNPDVTRDSVSDYLRMYEHYAL
jgi:hypothetical protein